MPHDTTTTAASDGNTMPMRPIAPQEHTPMHPFCWNSACACHQNSEARAQVAMAHRDGLCTAEEAARIIAGKHI
ncbi:MAG: hypothetical protein ACRDHZ_03360 [Ktedonobacteraceae bacterium]